MKLVADIEITLDTELLKRVQKAAEDAGLTLKEYIEQAIETCVSEGII